MDGTKSTPRDAAAANRTFVFADLAGFSALTEAHGDRVALDHIDRFVEVSQQAASGQDFVKSIGDAVMLSADTAQAGVEVAVRISQGCRRVDGLPLVRVGVHCGPAISRHGDWFGGAVNVASRVVDQAHGGQILASGAVERRLPQGTFELRPLGAHRLKNLRDTTELYEIRTGGEQPEGIVDPVCRMVILPNAAVGGFVHEGSEQWFCSHECADQFAAKPDAYLI